VIISVLYVVALTRLVILLLKLPEQFIMEVFISLNACTPLLFEFGCEKSFPISEEIVSGSFDQVHINL